MILALAVPEISLGAQKFKMGHVTLTTPLLRCFVIFMKGLDLAYLCTKCDDSSRSRDMLVPTKFYMVHVTKPRLFPRWFVVRGLVLATINMPTKLEVSISIHYEI